MTWNYLVCLLPRISRFRVVYPPNDKYHFFSARRYMWCVICVFISSKWECGIKRCIMWTVERINRSFFFCGCCSLRKEKTGKYLNKNFLIPSLEIICVVSFKIYTLFKLPIDYVKYRRRCRATLYLYFPLNLLFNIISACVWR